MKKSLISTLLLIVICFFVFTLSACSEKGNGSHNSSVQNSQNDEFNDSLSGEKHQKVQTAFDGVVESLLGAAESGAVGGENGANVACATAAADYGDTSAEAWREIAEAVQIDGDGEYMEYFTYAEEDYMLCITQVQYLKSLYEKINQNSGKLSFGTKYYDVVDGFVYLDMTTGKGGDDCNNTEANKYKYALTLAVAVDIDDNDLIKADCTIDVKLTQGEKVYNTKWSVLLLLNYDFTKSDINYALTMKTFNDEAELKYLNIDQNNAYAYVCVTDDKIVELRQFEYGSNKEMITDETHNSFDDYAAESEFEYGIIVANWFENHSWKQCFENAVSDSGKKTAVKAAFDELGMNRTAAGADEFANKIGEKNARIKEVVDDMTEIYGSDFVYNILLEDNDWQNNDGNSGNNGNNGNNGNSGNNENDGKIRITAALADGYTAYVGEPFDFTKVIVTVIYQKGDQTFKEIIEKNKDVFFDNLNTDKAGEEILTIRYYDAETRLPVIICERENLTITTDAPGIVYFNYSDPAEFELSVKVKNNSASEYNGVIFINIVGDEDYSFAFRPLSDDGVSFLSGRQPADGEFDIKFMVREAPNAPAVCENMFNDEGQIVLPCGEFSGYCILNAKIPANETAILKTHANIDVKEDRNYEIEVRTAHCSSKSAAIEVVCISEIYVDEKQDVLASDDEKTVRSKITVSIRGKRTELVKDYTILFKDNEFGGRKYAVEYKGVISEYHAMKS